MAAGLRERERLRDLFGRQVGEDVARAALEAGAAPRRRRSARSRCSSSTSSARRRWPASGRPTEVVALLNRFFGVVVEVVAAHGGWVNKFEGDARPVRLRRAGRARRPARRRAGAPRATSTTRLRARAAEVDAGIGVSAGTAVAGNVGAEQRFEYTVIGDPVNEAAAPVRAAPRACRSGVLASEAIVRRAGGDEAARWQLEDEVLLRGRPSRRASRRRARSPPDPGSERRGALAALTGDPRTRAPVPRALVRLRLRHAGAVATAGAQRAVPVGPRDDPHGEAPARQAAQVHARAQPLAAAHGRRACR